MLGSATEAEDVLQDILLAAWQGLGGFEERASLRTWLYRIATNRCLNARRAAARRADSERTASGWDVPGVEPPEPTRLGELTWLEPLPDGALDGPPGPEARYERRESVSLAFVTRCSACRRARSPSSSCVTSSGSTPTRWPTCWTRPPSR
jgi:RNA polymerase sigma factor (sigma-70 family)